MDIEFDLAKRAATLERRGIDFADAAVVFAGETIDFEDRRHAYPERRFVTIGNLRERMVVIIWTPTAEGRRIISMRKANVREQDKYR